MVGLMSLAWVTATSHCQLEVFPSLESLRCASEVKISDEGTDPCNNSECCSVESGKYQSPKKQEMLPIFVVTILPVDNFASLVKSLPLEVCLGILTAAPPELQTSWQFSLRTALPVRAPSVAS
jgi:hypothetical protein